MSDRLAGKVALVSAAGRGIGQGIALELAKAGAKVAVNSYREETASATAEKIREIGGEAIVVAGDITDAQFILDTLAATEKQLGPLDIVVNNVGAGPKEMPEADPGPLGAAAQLWDALYSQNLRAAVLMNEAVIPGFKERRYGKIINISSIAGKTSFSDNMLNMLVHPSYGAMKAALSHYTQTLAEILGPFNINVNAICPGIVYTDSWAGNAQQIVKNVPEFQGMDPKVWFDGIARGDYPQIFDRTPLRRDQTVEDMGNAVVFLASEESRNITGQNLMVDGGMVKL